MANTCMRETAAIAPCKPQILVPLQDTVTSQALEK
jgi:hypothetical protein